jgi:hypothetical protein
VLPWLPDGAPAAPPPRRQGRVVAGRRLVALVAAGASALAMLLVVAVHLWSVDGRAVSTPFLSYSAPPGWTPAPSGPEGQDGAAPLDVPTLTGVVHGPVYACGGESHLRGFAAAALLPTGPAAGTGPADRAASLARWFAAVSYAAPDGTAPEVTVAPPRPVRVDGPTGLVDGSITEATTRAAAGQDGCSATAGTVRVLAAPVTGGAALLLVAGDTGGGPPEPAPPERAALDAVLASVRLPAA